MVAVALLGRALEPFPTPIWHQEPETAHRVKQRTAAVMKWCIAQGF